MSDKHVHDCTGPDMTCPCGYRHRVPPISYSIEVFDRRTELVNDCFNCEDISVVIEELHRVIRKLEAL